MLVLTPGLDGNFVDIISFHPGHQPGVDALMQDLKAEFEFEFSSPTAKKMAELCQLPGYNYWIAIHNDTIVGTTGIILKDGYAVLKSMMLHRNYRGSHIAQTLLNTTMAFAKQSSINDMYLGTMAEFKAAQRFYEKNGFTPVDVNELPADFPANPVDVVFYHKTL